MKWALTFAVSCLGAIAAILALVWMLNGFSTGGISTHGIVAIVLGVTLTVLLAVALMALVFYSNRSGQDEQARHPGGRPGR
jgi:uncharacterized membrane protein